MKEFIIESYGKINLALDVLYKREDGYHQLNSIMQQISLKDKLIFKEIKEGIVIKSNSKEVPLDSTNLVYKAWDRLKQITGINKGIQIEIVKEIPVASGLAGGSANGAAALKALNYLWELNLSEEELMKIGKELGADIPFCIMGGTALAQGIGENLTKLKSFSGKSILLGNPGIGVSTAYAYSKLNLNGSERLDLDSLIASMEKEDLQEVASLIGNSMEEPIIKEHPIIGEIKSLMIKYGALGSLMSGSGPTVFGIFDDKEKMDFAKKKLGEKIPKVYSTTTI